MFLLGDIHRFKSDRHFFQEILQDDFSAQKWWENLATGGSIGFRLVVSAVLIFNTMFIWGLMSSWRNSSKLGRIGVNFFRQHLQIRGLFFRIHPLCQSCVGGFGELFQFWWVSQARFGLMS